MSASQFTPGPVELLVTPPGIRIAVDGHSDGVFGIDRRSYYDDGGNERVAHTITHLKTGGVVRHVRGGLANAKKIAALLHTVSWQFEDPSEAPRDGREEVVREAIATGLCVRHASLPDAALERAYEVMRAEANNG